MTTGQAVSYISLWLLVYFNIVFVSFSISYLHKRRGSKRLRFKIPIKLGVVSLLFLFTLFLYQSSLLFFVGVPLFGVSLAFIFFVEVARRIKWRLKRKKFSLF